MNKTELLARAKDLGVVGRHDMTKEELSIAVALAETKVNGASTQEVEGEVEVEPVCDLEDEEAAVTEVEAIAEEEEDAENVEEIPAADPEVVKDAKRKYPSTKPRDEHGRVIRKGVRFNLNVPYKEKLYYLSKAVSSRPGWDSALAAAPPQVRAIVKAMAAEYDVPSKASRGSIIVDYAKASGYLTTSIGSAELFAYYRRVLERLGVIHNTHLEEGDE